MTDDKQMQLEKGIDRMNGRYDCKPKNDDCTVSASQVYEDQKLHAIEFAEWMDKYGWLGTYHDDLLVGFHSVTSNGIISSAELYELFIKTKQ